MLWMQPTSRFSLAAVLLPVLAFSDAAPTNVVDLGYTQYKGNLTYPDTVAYLGLPYAEAPVGDRRFRAPLPLDTERVSREANGQVVTATTYPEPCILGSTGFGDLGGAGSEDCLKVNVYAPAGAQEGDDLPVLVYLYGNPSAFPLDHWVHQSPNVVIASIYYRLDSFGFLSVPEFSDNSVGDNNAGFQDQIQALKWVKQYIRAFGGDPSKVTISGESAGASSTELHLVAKEGEALFSQAIAQSVARAPVPQPEQQRPMFDFYTSKAGCGAEGIPVADRLTCLRNATVSALARAQETVMYNLSFAPVVDGKLITDIPSVSIINGDFANVPVIVGATSNETVSGGTNITAALKSFFPGLTSEDLEEYLQHYPSSEFECEQQRLADITGESELRCARDIIGLSVAKRNKAYTYRYNQPVPTANTTAVAHASDNWMMFRGTSTGFNGTTTFESQRPIDEALAAEMIAYWLSFVRSGDPNAYKLERAPEWPAFSAGRRTRIVLQEGNSTDVSGSVVEEEPQAEIDRCAFVASKSEHQQA
ncbi:alpha/beta-hydrolase [Trametes elegans]|nr:alpha/beta-hydrolase [Trametes elegans]